MFFLLSILIIDSNIAFAQKAPNKGQITQPSLKFEYYNIFPGGQELNLFGIEKKRETIGPGIISPDMEKVAYSEVYFYPQNKFFPIHLKSPAVSSSASFLSNASQNYQPLFQAPPVFYPAPLHTKQRLISLFVHICS